MRLFIAEKPDLARAIVQALEGPVEKSEGFISVGDDDVVTWCFGHLLTLSDPEYYNPDYKRWDMQHLPLQLTPIRHQPISDKTEQLKIIEKLLKKATSIVHAGDPDDEGQLLVDEILDFFNNKAPVQRILINDNNTQLVKKALGQMRDNKEFHGLYQSALARSVADQWYGYNLSRAYTLAARTKGHQGVLSVGRVQTPILGLVVRRDQLHESHQSQGYVTLTADFKVNNTQFSAKFVAPNDAPVDEKGRVIDEAYLKNIADCCKNQTADLTDVTHELKQAAAPLPYNLLTLQVDASQKLGLSPDKTLEITQSLREKHRLITYNRSDCQYLSDEQHADASSVLAAIAATSPQLTDHAKKGDPNLKSRAFNSEHVSAHHAIIPTQTHGDHNALSTDERAIYQLIARAYIAQFFEKQDYQETSVSILCETHQFKTSAKITLKEGWLVLYANDKTTEAAEDDEENDEQATDLRALKSGEQGICIATTVAKKKTKPLPRYTIATLLKDLTQVAKYIKDPHVQQLLKAKDKDKKGEHGGIGTPATRSSIIKNLMARGFIAEKNKKIISTDLGRQFHDVLPEKATLPDMTALWHEQQQRIQQGELSVDEFLTELTTYIRTEINILKNHGLTFASNAPLCPTCKTGHLLRRKGSKGHFWGCSQYPTCTSTCADEKGKPVLIKKQPAASTEHHCTACNKPLIRRAGKKKDTFWWGCSAYPECNSTYFDLSGKPNYASAKKVG